jgi:fatty-acyl-CoA synthase
MQLLTTDHMLLLQVQIVPAYQAPELLHSLTKVGVKALIFSEFFKSNSCYQIVRTVIPELDSCPESGVRLQNSKVPLLQFLIIMGSKQYR